MKHQILLVDDDILLQKSMSIFLSDEGFEVTTVGNGDEAVALIRQGLKKFSLALVDFHMPEVSGEETIKALKACDPDLFVYGFSGDDTLDVFNRTLSSGAVFFIQKDISNEKLLGLVHRACLEVENKFKTVNISTSPTENQKLIEQIGMIGVSDHLAQVAKMVIKFAPFNDAVLIRGENGTGKEKIARAIHNHSTRAKSPFIAVNCAAISESLLESEFFGHVKGAFTGAGKNKIGLIEAAEGGTLFLDEIGEMPVHLQSKLLRVLQDKRVVPVGATESISVDFRLISATNAPLEEMIKEGKFREDLYYRINVLPITLKALREHPEDIPALAISFLDQCNRETQQNRKILKSSMERLKSLHWPGNVRELQQAVKFLNAMSVTDNIDVEPYVRAAALKKIKVFDQLAALKNANHDEESSIIKKALSDERSISGASRSLNMSRSTFRDKMKKYKIAFESL